MAKNVLVLKHFESPKEAGVYYRLVCLTGGNKGESYVLMGTRIVMGRGDKTDVKLNDIKASREHVEITKVGANWVVTDLGSQNGIMVNDAKVTQHTLVEGDKLIVGQTVFKFARVEVGSRPKVVKEEAEEKSGNKGMIPLLVVVALIAMVFLSPDDKKEASSARKRNTEATYQDVSDEITTALQKRNANENKQLKEKLNVIYQRGLRELRERNYFRAIHEFNLALIIAPGDGQAEYYLRKSKEELDKEIESYTVMAQRDEGAIKYKSAIISYCSIIRLLYSVPDDPRHKNAVKQISDLESKLGLEAGETDCLKKQRTSQ